MKFSIVAVISVIASTVYAQAPANAGVAINLPSLGQVLNAGSSFVITWTPDSASSKPSDFIESIALMKGGSSNLEYYIRNILTSRIPVSPSSYTWNIPSNVETNPSYVLAIAGSNGATTYSTYFTIVGTPAGDGKPSVAPAASGASNSSPTSSSSSTGSSKPIASGNSNSTSSGNSLMVGVYGTVSIAGAVALLL